MDDALEAHTEHVRHHLPKPLAGRGNQLMKTTRKTTRKTINEIVPIANPVVTV